MSTLNRLFGGKKEVQLTKEQQEKIFLEFTKDRDQKIKETKDRILRQVRVYPGQDPYVAGHSALIRAETDGTIDNVIEQVKDKIAKKYKISKSQLTSIIQEETKSN